VPRGFTVVELLLTLAIFSILAGAGYSSYATVLERNRTAAGINDLMRIKFAIERFRTANDELPETLAEIGMDGMRDPWGSGYEYLNFETVNGNGQKRKDHNLVPINSEYDLYSKGPDGRSASPLTAAISKDDIIVANDGAFFGCASDY
jgi:general secretion pathway protein G